MSNASSPTPSTGTPIIRIRDLVFRRGDRTILDGISIDVPRGSIVAFMGPSGVGKMSHRGRMPRLADVARSQHISPRTLIRRLKRAGTSFQAIVDDVHRALAVDLLLHSELQVAEIGYRLGFRDPANFNRAFRGWTGQAPGRFRNLSRRAQAARSATQNATR